MSIKYYERDKKFVFNVCNDEKMQIYLQNELKLLSILNDVNQIKEF